MTEQRIIFSIKRSKEWRREQAIKLGRNAPTWVSVSIPIALLSEASRRWLYDYQSDAYPSRIDDLRCSLTGVTGFPDYVIDLHVDYEFDDGDDETAWASAIEDALSPAIAAIERFRADIAAICAQWAAQPLSERVSTTGEIDWPQLPEYYPKATRDYFTLHGIVTLSHYCPDAVTDSFEHSQKIKESIQCEV